MHDLNLFYREHPPMHQQDCVAACFEWLVQDDAESSVLVWLMASEGHFTFLTRGAFFGSP